MAPTAASNGGAGVLIDLDKLPLKRLEAIDEFGNEQLITDTNGEDSKLAAVRRIGFSWVVDREEKRTRKAETQQAWPWQGLVESLRQAQHELSVILDLINTVEPNDIVTVAAMQKPKQQINENLADVAVSAATKLQCLRHLGSYFKQASKSMERQVDKENRFYCSLLRLQQNWKVKWQRMVAIPPSSENLIFDLTDATQTDLSVVSRLSPFNTVQIKQDSSGLLAIQMPQRSFRTLGIKFNGDNLNFQGNPAKRRKLCRPDPPDAANSDDISKRIIQTHSALRDIHRSIFEEQVFDMINREVCNQPQGINVTWMQEDFLQLAVGQDYSLCLQISSLEDDLNCQTGNQSGCVQHEEVQDSTSMLIDTDEKEDIDKKFSLVVPNPVGLEIFLLHLFQENVLKRGKERYRNANRSEMLGQVTSDSDSLVGHFCSTVAHSVAFNQVLSELESLVARVPYLHLLSHPSWHSRISCWSVCVKVSDPALRPRRSLTTLDSSEAKQKHQLLFQTKVLLKDGQITLMGEGSAGNIPSSILSFTGGFSINRYKCDIEYLQMILLQQVASQIIQWLQEEATVLGMNTSRDFLTLHFYLDQGGIFSLTANVDPDDISGCISWWAVTIDRTSLDDRKYLLEHTRSENHRQFLGYLSLGTLHSLLMDLIKLCEDGTARKT